MLLFIGPLLRIIIKCRRCIVSKKNRLHFAVYYNNDCYRLSPYSNPPCVSGFITESTTTSMVVLCFPITTDQYPPLMAAESDVKKITCTITTDISSHTACGLMKRSGRFSQRTMTLARVAFDHRGVQLGGKRCLKFRSPVCSGGIIHTYLIYIHTYKL